MGNLLFSYFGIFNISHIIPELARFGKDIFWWVSTRSKLEKVIGAIGVLIIVIKIFSINSTPEYVLPLFAKLLLEVIILSYLLYISSMYWFVKGYRSKLSYLLGNRELLRGFIVKLKESNFFTVRPTKLIADGKINSNELEIVAAIYMPHKAQESTKHRYIAYLLLFSLAQIILNPYGLFLIAIIFIATYIHITFYDKNSGYLIRDSLRKTAQALYNYHAYDPEKCKNIII